MEIHMTGVRLPTFYSLESLGSLKISRRNPWTLFSLF